MLPIKKKKRKKIDLTEYLLIGWSEWCALPELGIASIKAKIDTGAKTSAIHAYSITAYQLRNKHFVRFNIHPLPKRDDITISCNAEVIDQRHVMSSNGHIENRYVITTPIRLGEQEWNIELTLSNRDPLRFRMLLGREALKGRVVIDPSRRLLQKRRKKFRLIKPPSKIII